MEGRAYSEGCEQAGETGCWAALTFSTGERKALHLGWNSPVQQHSLGSDEALVSNELLILSSLVCRSM